MPEENINTDEKSEDNNSYDELDDILNDKEDGNEDEKKDDSKDDEEKSEDENKKEDESNKFFKKIGTHSFDNEKDYDEFVSKTYHTNSELSGEVKKLGGDPKNLGKEIEKPTEEKKVDTEEKKAKSPEETYYEIENIRFMKKFPDAKEYKEEMKAYIKSGRANINEEPSYSLAFARALRGDGKPIPDNLLRIIKTEKGEDPDESQSATKKIMRSGSRSGNAIELKSFNSQEELDEISEFGDKVALGKF